PNRESYCIRQDTFGFLHGQDMDVEAQAAVKARKKQEPWPKAREGPVMSRKVSCSGVAP
ncbi:unnamed protein product, partial [Ascophyllum nodosum]